jgi:hypothetical protein
VDEQVVKLRQQKPAAGRKTTGATGVPLVVDSLSPKPKAKPVPPQLKRVLGSATGTIKFKRGWNAPMTDKEFEEFLGE